MVLVVRWVFRAAALVLLTVTCACGRVGYNALSQVIVGDGDAAPTDASFSDGGVLEASGDAATADASSVDASENDASNLDAGGVDAGTSDAGGPPPRTCAEVLAQNPGADSGNYTIEPTPGSPVDVFCEMGRSGGGWTRIEAFDASIDPCPGDWMRLVGPPVVCAREMNTAGFRSASFPTLFEYQEVLGFAIGYQKASTDAFNGGVGSLDQDYVDGISITYRDVVGDRAHLWTYASAWSEADFTQPSNVCPCRGGRAPPAFVGTDYWCESGTPGHPVMQGCRLWYFGDPLWNGDHDGMACAVPSPTPWFERSLPQPTTAPIEVRLMMNQVSCEDVGIAQLELYVR